MVTEVSKAVCRGLDCLLGKSIDIICDKTSYCKGCLICYKDKEYFYELIIRQGRYKRKHIIFYPICVDCQKECMTLDYRISKIQDEKAQELLYNLIDEGISHPHCNKVIRICE